VSQNQASGAAANKWGRECARKIASKIGATMLTSTSNEARLGGKHVVIKCAKRNTNNVGVTYKMLKTIKEVVAAFQSVDGSFGVWRLPTKIFQAETRPTKSRGPARGKVGKVDRAVFCRRGTLMGHFRID
jgi:hypothetical protein